MRLLPSRSTYGTTPCLMIGQRSVVMEGGVLLETICREVTNPNAREAATPSRWLLPAAAGHGARGAVVVPHIIPLRA